MRWKNWTAGMCGIELLSNKIRIFISLVHKDYTLSWGMTKAYIELGEVQQKLFLFGEVLFKPFLLSEMWQKHMQHLVRCSKSVGQEHFLKSDWACPTESRTIPQISWGAWEALFKFFLSIWLGDRTAKYTVRCMESRICSEVHEMSLVDWWGDGTVFSRKKQSC